MKKCFDFSGFGIIAEQHIKELNYIQKLELKPYSKVHYLILLDNNQNDKVMDCLEQLKQIAGVKIESSLN